MPKKKRDSRQPRSRVSASQMATEIRTELRGILRRIDALRRPLSPRMTEHMVNGKQCYSLDEVSTYEAIHEEVIALAGMVWHLKDRLKRWMSAARLEYSPSIEDLAAAQVSLLICGDLIDSKKHGGGSNRSGFAPQVEGISFQPKGGIAIRYDGALKVGEIRVMHPDPIPYTVEIVTGDGTGTFGPAIDVICQAFETRRDLIEKADLLGGSDPESVQLRRLFSRFEQGVTPIFRSELIG